jgi:hypothetical protein
MAASDPRRIETPLGAYVSLEALESHMVERIDGPGLMLHVGMQDPQDVRCVEVVLDLGAVAELYRLSGEWMERNI